MKTELICASLAEMAYLTRFDHAPTERLAAAAEQGRCFIITADGQRAGVLRYSLFWESIPFLDLIYLEENVRRKGIGKQAMGMWEDMMNKAGHGMVMTSTQSDEQAQHFYRALGYRESGCLILDHPGYEQPMELFFTKAL